MRDAIAADHIEWAYVVWEDNKGLSFQSFINIVPSAAIMPVPDLEIDWPKGMATVQRRRGVVECPVVVSRRDLDRELANITASPEATDHTHSGMAGRPTPKHLYFQEMRRRAAAGLLQDSVVQESCDLRDWMGQEYKHLNPGTAKVIENAIRDEHRDLLAKRNAQRSGKGKQRMA